MVATDNLNLTIVKLTGSEHTTINIGGIFGNSEEAVENGEPIISQGDISTSIASPSLYLLNDRKSYHGKCLPLHKAALKGNVEEVNRLLHNDRNMLSAAITYGHETILHVAAGARQTGAVAEIIKLMKPEELMLQDQNGNTAFCFAAAVGNVGIAQMMLAKNPSLLNIRGSKNMTPLYFAALFGQRKMATFLYNQSEIILEVEDRRDIFFISITSSLYDLALKLLKGDKDLAVARHVQHGTALHMLAPIPSAFSARRPEVLDRLINSFPGNKFTDNEELMSTQALALVKRLWREIIRRDNVDVLKLIREPSKLLFDAAKLGNYEFLAQLICSYPDLVHELDENNRSIFHVAVMHRHANILSIIYEIGFDKELIATYVDKHGNNILHLAALYPPSIPAKTVSGAALEMQRELLTFKEVEKLVQPSFREMKNSEGQIPRELFTMAHTELLKSGEQWMKSTAKTCMLVATLIAMVVFVATASVPIGNIDETVGKYLSYSRTLFQVIVMAKAIALSSSSLSVLIFLSILTSPFAENDFLRSLPFQLMVGLSTLSISLISLMVAFISTFMLVFKDISNWFSLLAIALASLPVTAIVLLQYPHLRQIFCLLNRSRILF